jgi:hypothetical protein
VCLTMLLYVFQPTVLQLLAYETNVRVLTLI